MAGTQTLIELGKLTDEGAFESLITSILRETDAKYKSIVHTGINDSGRTVKAPLDGITYEPGANPPHLIAAHHTIAGRNNLRNKWLHDTSTVKARTPKGPTSVDGDLVKTAKIVKTERLKNPELLVTLVISTIYEPDIELVKDVHEFARNHHISLDLWSASRIADFLDSSPKGQWLRKEHLRIDAELLSRELLYKVCSELLDNYPQTDNPDAWIQGQSYEMTRASVDNSLTFLLGESGLGKSVACYQTLKSHLTNGGVGLIVDEAVIVTSNSLEEALTKTIKQAFPLLSSLSQPVSAFVSAEDPLIVVIEDVNRAAFPDRVLERLTTWHGRMLEPARPQSKKHRFRIVCPVSPNTLLKLKDQLQQLIGKHSIEIRRFDPHQGERAVLRRAEMRGQELSSLDAHRISRALGNDPLLIALSNYENVGSFDPQSTIDGYIETTIQRISSTKAAITATELKGALLKLGAAMIQQRCLDVYWADVSGWASISNEQRTSLSIITQDRSILMLSGNSDKQRLAFRHDRVENQVLADSASLLWCENELSDEILSDPFFADILGIAISTNSAAHTFVEAVGRSNPLSLFVALKRIGNSRNPNYELIVSMINGWLGKSDFLSYRFMSLRHRALLELSETDSNHVISIANRFPHESDYKYFAVLRNGGLAGALNICVRLEPGVGATWRDMQFEHARLHHGATLIQGLADYLQRQDIKRSHRVAALRYAGHLADVKLRDGIQISWNNDNNREQNLAEYLWAFAQCCGMDAQGCLEQVCLGWASLPNESAREHDVSPRVALIQHNIEWAFRRWPPIHAVEYFIQRAAHSDLQWAITLMLDGIDDPRVLRFIVTRYGEIDKRSAESGGFSPYLSMARDKWKPNRASHGEPMSKASRSELERIWQSPAFDKYIRRQALYLWENVSSPVDLSILNAAQEPESIADEILRIRIRWGDMTSLPLLISNLQSQKPLFWWRLARHIWCDELKRELETHIKMRGDSSDKRWRKGGDDDYLMAELFAYLPLLDAEYLLTNYWQHLRDSVEFVQAALYHASEPLLQLVEQAVSSSSDPKRIFRNISMRHGIRHSGHPGIVSRRQIEALRPYMDHIEPMDIRMYWDECTEKGWLDLRTELFEPRLLDEHRPRSWDRESIMRELSRMKNTMGHPWIEHKLQEIMDAGHSWTDVMLALKEWLTQNKSAGGVSLVSGFIRVRGTRKDLHVFDVVQDCTDTNVQDILQDTRFAVFARSLT